VTEESLADRRRALARYYDLDVVKESDDIPMYLALASATDGPILELACGSGRIAIPLAAAGSDVTGVDNDPGMLDRARARWQQRASDVAGNPGSLDLVEADMTTLQLDRRFDLVILGFNSILLLADRGAQQRVIDTMARHLSGDGRALIDVWLPTDDDLTLYDGRVMTDWTRRDDATGSEVTKMTSATHDAQTRRATVDTIFEEWRDDRPLSRIEKRDEIRFVTAHEILEMIDAAGLQPEVLADDYSMSQYQPHSERLIAIAARTGGTRTTGPDGGRL